VDFFKQLSTLSSNDRLWEPVTEIGAKVKVFEAGKALCDQLRSWQAATRTRAFQQKETTVIRIGLLGNLQQQAQQSIKLQRRRLYANVFVRQFLE